MVGTPGFEPGTSVLSGLRSNQLSYVPEVILLASTVPFSAEYTMGEAIFQEKKKEASGRLPSVNWVF